MCQSLSLYVLSTQIDVLGTISKPADAELNITAQTPGENCSSAISDIVQLVSYNQWVSFCMCSVIQDVFYTLRYFISTANQM